MVFAQRCGAPVRVAHGSLSLKYLLAARASAISAPPASRNRYWSMRAPICSGAAVWQRRGDQRARVMPVIHGGDCSGRENADKSGVAALRGARSLSFRAGAGIIPRLEGSQQPACRIEVP
jgi:hypothetical protein